MERWLHLSAWGLLLPYCLTLAGCTLVQIHEKDNILSRTRKNVDKLERRQISARLDAIVPKGEQLELRYNLTVTTVRTDRQIFDETVKQERQLLHDGKFKYFVGWISFAFETEGSANYSLYLLGGIPLTLGINVPIAIADWISMPFRLRDATIERKAHEDIVTAKAKAPVPDCSLYSIRIAKENYPLAADCRLILRRDAFTEIATRHAYPPQFDAAFRYELLQNRETIVLMNSQILIRNLTAAARRIEHVER